ncbi:8043_t:CDS:2 [Cetraspora pellucida]|uniref:8043_t:CDS:1 n=1 Tax=Cetraspora pellucida TaxID=1433469 RepID=A0ACA9N4J6_9GLOM|nr:8043_t:CDS:2 [Cetraspora pellucida]
MHTIIPVNAASKFLTANEIYINAVYEIYSFCFEHNLVFLWVYLWPAWYKIIRWFLWARSAHLTIPLNWIQCAIKKIDDNDDTRYFIDLAHWVMLLDSQGIRLVYGNFKRQEDYPFLIWNTNEDGLTQIDEDDCLLDPDMCQICEQKVAAVRCMANHLEQELSVNNLNHIT